MIIKDAKQYAKELMESLLRIDFMSREQARQSALININMLLNSHKLPIKNIRYYEEVLRELTAYENNKNS